VQTSPRRVALIALAIVPSVLTLCLASALALYLHGRAERRARIRQRATDRRLDGVEDGQRKLGQKVEEVSRDLEELTPTKLHVLLAVDKSGQETGVWGKSICKGARTYVNEHPTLLVKGRPYQLHLSTEDDRGNPDEAERTAQLLPEREKEGKYPFAVIGPISTGAASRSLREYASVYETHRPAVHLLPVPTGTHVLQDDAGRRISPHMFRMPPNNKQQALAILRTIEREEWLPVAVYALTHATTNEYVGDLARELTSQAQEILDISLKVSYIQNVATVNRFRKAVRKKPRAVVVIGPWDSHPTDPSAERFIKAWREAEMAEGQAPATILLPDFAVPGAESACARDVNLDLSDVLGVFQLDPNKDGYRGGVGLGLERSELLSRMLRAYGYDAMHILAEALLEADSTDPGIVSSAVARLGTIPGRAQDYDFRYDTGENACAGFHVYSFPARDRDGAEHPGDCREMKHAHECHCKWSDTMPSENKRSHKVDRPKEDPARKEPKNEVKDGAPENSGAIEKARTKRQKCV
jgi:hypothetical protein